MKNFLLLAFCAALFAGCYGTSAGNLNEKTFAQQYAELEKEPPQQVEPSSNIAFQTAADREAEVAIAAQKERRAQPPLVESNYIFQVMPDKGVYSYDEYGQVWNEAPKEKDYKAAKRLWSKPARHRGDYVAPAAPSAAPADAGFSEADDGDWGY